MKQKTVIETRTAELKDYDWLSYEISSDGDIEFVADEATIAAAAKAWKMTPAAVSAIKTSFDYLVETLVEALEADLADIWKAANSAGKTNA